MVLLRHECLFHRFNHRGIERASHQMASLMLQRAVISSCLSSPSASPSDGRLASTFKQQLLLRAAPAEAHCCSASSRRLRRDRAGVLASMALPTGELSSSSFSPLTSDEGHRGFSARVCVNRGSVQSQQKQQQQWQQAWRDSASSSTGRRRGQSVLTRALPVDAYWITAFQAMLVAGLMGGFAVVTGILINIRIEVQALEEYQDLEAKGMLPEDMSIPDDDWDIEAPLYIFKSNDWSSTSNPPRNRPVREEVEQPEIKPELEPELKTASTD